MTSYWCAYAWLPDGVSAGVRIDVEDGEITTVQPGAPRAGEVLHGLTVPGFANTHSHAFHRALRGRTHDDRGTFWTWRDRMYRLASLLTPDSYYRLARAVYAEMVLAGYTSVGEFHYLHHAPGGHRYANPNAMSEALAAAADDAGIRLCLLDTCYLTSGSGGELEQHQSRFGDGDVYSWAERVEEFTPDSALVRLGAAAHSVRAVPMEALPVISEWAGSRPLHVHLSEQRDENQQSLRRYGRSPASVLADAGVLGERTVAVHGTHLGAADIAALGHTSTATCFCPTTERDLGDGIGPGRELLDAGSPLCLGSDSHAVIDPIEEIRALETNERLLHEQRGRFTMDELLSAATRHQDNGWPEAGALARGMAADLVSIDLDSPRTAGASPDGVLFAAGASDVRDVLIAGRHVVRDGRHQLVERPEAVLAEEIEALWQ